MNLATLSNAHVERLRQYYNLKLDHPAIAEMLRCGWLRSVTRTEAEELLGLKSNTLETGGLLIRYPNAPETLTVRLDAPYAGPDGRERKYLRPAGQANRLFVPPGVSLDSRELMLTEGELKSLAAVTHGLPCVAVAGVWCWRSRGGRPDFDDPPDSEALIADLKREWTNTRFVLIYDSDITTQHEAYPAFQRLAEQLYARGALSVKILTLPKLDGAAKVGLDDFLRLRSAAGGDPVAELNMLVARTATYMPVGDGAEMFATQRFAAWPADPDALLQATTALLAAKGEVYVQKWLKEWVRDSELRKAALKEAKEKLPKHVAPKPTPRASNKLFGGILSRYAGTGYTVNAAGELCYVRATQFGEELIPLANFVPYIAREVAEDNGVERSVIFEITGKLASGQELPTARVPAAKLASMSWVLEHWGARANILPGQMARDRVRHAIQSTAEHAERVTVFTHTGWRKLGNQWLFLHAGGAIPGGSVVVGVDQHLVRYRLPAAVENARTAVEFSLALRGVAPLEVTVPLLCLVYLAPLCEPLRQADAEPAFAVWLYGRSGAGKTSLAAVMASHFGTFDARTLPANFRSTTNYLEKLGFLAKDILLVVDDYHPPHDFRERQRLEQTAQHLLRLYGDRAARGRMESSTELRSSFPPRGVVLVTGEELPVGESSNARLFLLELAKGKLDFSELTRFQRQRNLLAQAMAGYITWLSPQLDSLVPVLRENFEEYRAYFSQLDGHPRTGENAAWLYLGWILLLNFACEVGAISEPQQQELAQEGYLVLTELLNSQCQRIEEERPAQRFLTLVREIFLQGRGHLLEADGTKPERPELYGWSRDEEVPVPLGEFLGWVKGDWVLLLPDSTYRLVAELSRRQGILFPVQPKTLWRHLDQEGWIAIERDGERVYRLVRETVAGRRLRVLKLRRDAIFAE